MERSAASGSEREEFCSWGPWRAVGGCISCALSVMSRAAKFVVFLGGN